MSKESNRRARARSRPTPAQWREWIDIDPATGVMHWRAHPTDPRRNGTIATRKGAKGYLAVCVLGRSFLAHTVAYAIYNGRYAAPTVDHDDRNTKNNSKVNLVEATRSTQNRNRSGWSRSGFRGVEQRASGRWAARAQLDGRRMVTIGIRDTAEQAARLRDAFVRDIMWNPILNFPNEARDLIEIRDASRG